MDKHQMFVLVVQTGAILGDINFQRSIAAQVVTEACEIDPAVIPEGFGFAAQQYLNWVYGNGQRPEWL